MRNHWRYGSHQNTQTPPNSHKVLGWHLKITIHTHYVEKISMYSLAGFLTHMFAASNERPTVKRNLLHTQRRLATT